MAEYYFKKFGKFRAHLFACVFLFSLSGDRKKVESPAQEEHVAKLKDLRSTVGCSASLSTLLNTSLVRFLVCFGRRSPKTRDAKDSISITDFPIDLTRNTLFSEPADHREE
jgi:hypothetical protein